MIDRKYIYILNGHQVYNTMSYNIMYCNKSCPNIRGRLCIGMVDIVHELRTECHCQIWSVSVDEVWPCKFRQKIMYSAGIS